MKKMLLKKYRRTGVIINYICLILICLFYELGVINEFTTPIIIAGIGLFIIFLISFFFTYIRTKIWKQVHLPLKKLDEREVMVVYNALRWSYSLFAIFIIGIIYIFMLSERYIGAITAAGIIYFAHILPASILAWSEKEV